MALDQQNSSFAGRGTPGPLVDQSNFSVVRLPGLAIVFDQFTESLAAGVALLCRGAATFEVEAIETATLFETLDECRGLVAGVAHCPDLDARAMAIYDRAFIDTLAHVVFGAKQAVSSVPAEASNRPVTRIERQLVERVSRTAAKALSVGLSGFTEAAFAFERQETIIDNQFLGRRDAPVVSARVRMEAAGANGALLIVIQQPTLLPIRQKLAKDPESEAPAVDPRWAKQLKAGLASALVPVNGVLEEIEMTLGEISNLSVGHVLTLRGGDSGRVKLESGGHNLFWCKLVQTDGRYTLEIEDPIGAEKDPFDAMSAN
jgi:flagellar motor switch protein FliM